jgi:hypothetical protein
VIRAWDELAARLDDRIPLSLVAIGLLVLGTLVGLLLYMYPSWLPWRWWSRFWPAVWRGLRALGRGVVALVRAVGRLPARLRGLRWGGLRARWRIGRLSLRRRRRVRPAGTVAAPVADDELPDLPATDFRALADWYAAAGRYAEAVRERLRGMLRSLVEAGVIEAPPGSTVVELTAAVRWALPPVHPPVSAACQLFSDIWYGQRPATATDDAQVRGYADQVGAALTVGVPR